MKERIRRCNSHAVIEKNLANGHDSAKGCTYYTTLEGQICSFRRGVRVKYLPTSLLILCTVRTYITWNEYGAGCISSLKMGPVPDAMLAICLITQPLAEESFISKLRYNVAGAGCSGPFSVPFRQIHI